MAAITGLRQLQAGRPERTAVAQLGQVAQVGAGARTPCSSPVSTATRRESSASKARKLVVQPLGGLAVHGVAHVALVDADDDDTVGQRRRSVMAADRSGAGCTVALVRVISGSARGRRAGGARGLRAPGPRPTACGRPPSTPSGASARWTQAAVLDLFAGSGAMGIEALSRGAARATFVDQDIERPAGHRGQPGHLRPRRRRARSWPRPSSASWPVRQQRRWDLALLDPPYDYDGWPELLLDLPAPTRRCWSRTGRSSRRSAGRCVRAKRYGRTHVVIAERIAV